MKCCWYEDDDDNDGYYKTDNDDDNDDDIDDDDDDDDDVDCNHDEDDVSFIFMWLGFPTVHDSFSLLVINGPFAGIGNFCNKFKIWMLFSWWSVFIRRKKKDNS